MKTLQEVQCVGFDIINYINKLLPFGRKFLIDLIPVKSIKVKNKATKGKCVCVCVCSQACINVCVCICIQSHNMIKCIRILLGSFWKHDLIHTFSIFPNIDLLLL